MHSVVQLFDEYIARLKSIVALKELSMGEGAAVVDITFPLSFSASLTVSVFGIVYFESSGRMYMLAVMVAVYDPSSFGMLERLVTANALVPVLSLSA